MSQARSSMQPLIGALLAAAVAFARGAAAQPPVAAEAEVSAPTTTVGSLGPDVVLFDTTNTLRFTWFHSVTFSPHEPGVAYVPSFEGHMYKTTDDGRTWDESRLIIDNRPFYGDAGQFVYFGVHRRGTAAWNVLHATGQPSTSAARLRVHRSSFEIAHGDGTAYVDTVDALGPRPRYRPRTRRTSRTAALLLGMRPGPFGIDHIDPTGDSRVAGGAANVNFGIGLPGRAPRLQNVVRKFAFARPAPLGIPVGASGLNIKQTLLSRGERPTEIRLAIIHPREPQTVYALTFYGLYRTKDGGLNWYRTFQGVSVRDSEINHLAVDPNDGRRVLLATSNGIYVSEDGAENFIKLTAQGVGEGKVRWIWYSPYHPGYVFACTDNGLLRSKNSGRDWEWVYYTTFPPARIVFYVDLDPFTKRTGYIATTDGLFVTDDLIHGGLEDWRRFGGLAFTGMESKKVVACPKHKGHLWAMTNTLLPLLTRPGYELMGGAYLWETLDGGDDWRIIFSGNTWGTLEWFDNDPRDPDLLWIAWSRALIKMERRKFVAQAEEEKRRRAAEADLQRYPSQADVMMAARRFAGTDYARQLAFRRGATLRSFVPRLDMSYAQLRYRGLPLLQDGLYDFPFRLRETSSFAFREFRAMVNWDLSPLVFNLDTTLFGRISRMIGDIDRYLRMVVHRSYGELQRLRTLMITEPPADLRVRVLYRTRIEELEAYVDLITGGYLTRYRQGDRPRGWDTPWFRRWDGVPRQWFGEGEKP